MKKNKIIRFLLLGVIISATMVSCGKGCGGGSTEPSKVVSFASSELPSDNSVYLESKSTFNDEITLDIKIKAGCNVYAASFYLTYDGSKINYISIKEGSYFNHDGAGTLFKAELDKGQQGVLIVGITRSGIVSGVGGDGTLATVVLKAMVEQAGTVIGFNTAGSTLDLPDDYDNNPMNDHISGTDWLGGSLNYQ